MVGTIVLLVIGLIFLVFGVQIGAALGLFIGAAQKDDHAIFGFFAGYVFGVLLAAAGLTVVIFQAISLVQQLTS